MADKGWFETRPTAHVYPVGFPVYVVHAALPHTRQFPFLCVALHLQLLGAGSGGGRELHLQRLPLFILRQAFSFSLLVQLLSLSHQCVHSSGIPWTVEDRTPYPARFETRLSAHVYPVGFPAYVVHAAFRQIRQFPLLCVALHLQLLETGDGGRGRLHLQRLPLLTLRHVFLLFRLVHPAAA